MGHYIYWLDVKAHIDPEAFTDGPDGTMDIDAVDLRIEEAEAKFDARFSRRYDLPFTEAAEPDAFSLTKKIVSRWAAAQYLRFARQVETSADRMTYVEQLERTAEDFVEMLQVRRQPDDATEADEPIVHIPSDGETATSTARPAIFKRDHITAGNSSHY